MRSPRNVDLYTSWHAGPLAAEPLDVIELDDDEGTAKEHACSKYARHVHARKQEHKKGARRQCQWHFFATGIFLRA
jgi:hypothetical protein